MKLDDAIDYFDGKSESEKPSKMPDSSQIKKWLIELRELREELEVWLEREINGNLVMSEEKPEVDEDYSRKYKWKDGTSVFVFNSRQCLKDVTYENSPRRARLILEDEEMITREKSIKRAAIYAGINDSNKGRARETYYISALADHENGFYEGFVQGAEWADNNPHWISVESELPDNTRNVLAITVNEEIRILYYHEVMESWYDENNGFMYTITRFVR